jgi:23S rRNA (cytidine1920-2'-O)/16S rRNA (cytidine1409-2'-O)-methyltransferase
LGGKPRRRLRALAAEFMRAYPDLGEPETHIERGVLVDGRLVDNPRSLVREGARIELLRDTPLRGGRKLRAALEAFHVHVAGRVALDVGAAAGGFTRVLLEAGAARVYAVDAGYGQLLGSLRQNPRVVVLERVNLGALDRAHVPEAVDVITIDLSYLALWKAIPQLARVDIAPGADLVALVKPMFELGLASPPTEPAALARALERATRGLEANGWSVDGSIRSPVRGGRGAIELLLHATGAP